MEINGQLHAAAALSPWKEPPLTLNMRPGWFRSLEGFGEEKISCPFGSRTPYCPARSYSKFCDRLQMKLRNKLCQFSSLETNVASKHVGQSYFNRNQDFVRFD